MVTDNCEDPTLIRRPIDRVALPHILAILYGIEYPAEAEQGGEGNRGEIRRSLEKSESALIPTLPTLRHPQLTVLCDSERPSSTNLAGYLIPKRA